MTVARLPPLRQRPTTVVLLAHRGTATERTENTMDAFAWAIEHGATWMETDLRMTADRQLVCLHDPTPARVFPGYREPINKITLADAQAIGITPWKDALAAWPDISWNVDLKARGVATLTAAYLNRIPADAARVRVASFSGRELLRFRMLTGGRIATVATPEETGLAIANAMTGRPMRIPVYTAIQPPFRLATKRLVDAAHRAGIEVHPWTVNEIDLGQRLANRGVDGLITDRVDLMRGLAWRPRQSRHPALTGR